MFSGRRPLWANASAEARNNINCDLAFDSTLVASLSEGGVGRLFWAADGRSVALFGAETAPNRARGKSRERTEGQLSLSLGEKTSPSQL